MSLYKRGSTWWIDFATPSGERIRRSAETESKAEAKELYDKLKAESWRVAKLGDKPKHTWDEAAYKWLMETEYKKTHHLDVAMITWLQQYFTVKDCYKRKNAPDRMSVHGERDMWQGKRSNSGA